MSSRGESDPYDQCARRKSGDRVGILNKVDKMSGKGIGDIGRNNNPVRMELNSRL